MRQWTTLHKYMWLRILQGANAVYETVKGAIISFTTKKAAPLTELKVEFSPVQDLHGYANPWPAGGGANILPPAESLTPATNGNLTVTPYADGHYHIKKTSDTSNRGLSVNLSATVDVTTALYFTPLASVGGTGAMVCNLRTSEPSTLTSAYVGKASSLCTADGTAAQLYFYFTSASEYEGDLWPMVTSSAVTAWTPYSNLCPISGWDSLNVGQTGKNMLPTWSSTTAIGLQIETDTDGSVRIHGKATGTGGYFSDPNNPMTFPVPIPKGTAITISVGTQLPKRIRFFLMDKAMTNAASWDINAGFSSTTGTTPFDVYAIRAYGNADVDTDYDFTIYPMLTLGSSAPAEYVPYSGTTVSVTFPALGKNTLDPSATTWKKWYLNSNKLGVLTDDSTIVDYSVSGDEITVTITSGNHRGIGFSVDAVDYDRTVSVNGDVPGSIYLFDSYTASAGITRTGANNALTIPTNTSGFVAFRWTDGGTYTIKVQFEKGSSATAYEPYTNTAYSGTYEFVTGVLTVDMAYATFDGSETWYVGAVGIPSLSRFYTNLTDGKNNGDIISNMLIGGTAQGTNRVRQNTVSSVVRLDCYVLKGDFPTKDDWTSYIANNPLQVVYELAEPLVFQLTPQIINTLKGDNTIWANTNGDVEVTYRSN